MTPDDEIARRIAGASGPSWSAVECVLRGMHAERERVVAWLSSNDDHGLRGEGMMRARLAIEAGAHLLPTSATPATEPVQSRSVLRREASQRGEPMPTFPA